MLPTTVAAPRNAIRSLPPRPRRSRISWRGSSLTLSGSRCRAPSPLVERLAATVARVELVPVVDLVLAELPAEVDLLARDHRREVEQAAVDVAEDDPRLLHHLEQAPHLEEGDAHLTAFLAAAVAAGGLRERLVGLLVGELVLGVAELAQQRLQLREERVRLLAGEVALVDELCSLLAHALLGTAAESRSRSSSASDSPIVRSWPWKARCQCSAGHLRTCSSSGASSSAGTKPSSARPGTGSASPRHG